MQYAHWITEEYVLLVEQRTCRACGTTHTAPGRMRVRLRSTSGATRTIEPGAAQWSHGELAALPRRIQHVPMQTDYCHECFMRNAPTGTAPARRMTTDEIDSQRKTNLPDFASFTIRTPPRSKRNV